MEILAPDAPVPDAVRLPRIVRSWRDGREKISVFQFADGGQWALSDRALANLPFISSDPAEVFARAPRVFYFLGRKAR